MKTIDKTILGLCVFTILAMFGAPFGVAYDLQKNKPPYYLTDDELDKTLDVDTETNKPEDYVRVLYFHRVPGCSTCQTMAKYVYETILRDYPKEVKKRQIILRYYDFENPKNTNLVKAFKISSPTLVLVQGRGGKDVKAKRADKIWALAGDKTAFVKYVDKEIDGYLKPNEQKKNKE